MNPFFRALALTFLLTSALPAGPAQACDLKNCPHHAHHAAAAESAKSKDPHCGCPCGDTGKATGDKATQKAHACSDAHCKMAKCTDKKCCHFEGHEHHDS